MTITIKTSTPVGHMNELAQAIVAELEFGARIAVNIRGMLDDQDFSQIERAASELAETFGNSSDPVKRLRAKLDDYGKLKGNKRYTVKTLSGVWKVVVKAQKKVEKGKAVESCHTYMGKIADMATNAKLTPSEKEGLIQELRVALGLKEPEKAAKAA